MDLKELLCTVDDTAKNRETVAFKDILNVVGHRSFGPLLLLAGLITIAPVIGDLPGVPTLLGIFVILISGQLLFGRDQFWLPQWLARQAVNAEKLNKVVRWLQKPVGYINRLLQPRLQMLVRERGKHVVAAFCLLIGLAMPLMEFIPFSANGAGAALTAFGIALLANDGLWALIAYLIVAATLVLVIFFV